MRLSKLVEGLYRKVFVGIVVTPESTEVRVTVTKGVTALESHDKRFDSPNVTDALVDYLRSYTQDTPFYYIGLLNPTLQQGALTGCPHSDMPDGPDLSTAVTLCRNNSWSVYSEKPELDALQKKYRSFGLDFIFSPFFLLERYYADKVSGELALYVLVQDEQLSLAIFENDVLCYAEHVQVKVGSDASETAEDDQEQISFDFEGAGLDEGIHLDDIDAIDELDGLEDLGNIEDLDTIEEIDEFAEEISEFEAADEGGDDSLEAFGIDFERFEAIQNMLQNFYAEGSSGAFVETVYIADGCGVSEDLRRYLEEELFLHVVIRHMELCQEIVALARKEAEHAV